MYQKKKDNSILRLAILVLILAIAALNDIDMERIILEKDRVASIKYHHEINLEQFLENCKGETK